MKIVLSYHEAQGVTSSSQQKNGVGNVIREDDLGKPSSKGSNQDSRGEAPQRGNQNLEEEEDQRLEQHRTGIHLMEHNR